MIYSIKNKIIQKILNDEIVILPTETVYGIGARYDSQTAIDKLFDIKNRNIEKPISLHITKNMLDQFNIPKNLHNLCDRLFPGPFTLIIKSDIPHGFHSRSKFTGKIGIRVPENRVFQEILNEVKMPLCMTSANISSHDNASKFSEITIDAMGIEDDQNVTGNESLIIDTTTHHMRTIRV
ncbi:Sua5/YciO/YrdC/YwlC family protein [Candidatus Cytomitobacter indipagum]|uniref:L-threonylcarbamoyladenylate synthase n=1 Tax=Candidatus Cytomitobacter indipagum TaxID=2601575 RepID=A0A5C0UGR2_9PROT|nr:Sua5/YciO/YrdC/YwlC family protein [Candidatus Cytomitobacter indipagum]QEK38224.1 Sua5/YciO/YrdC/YwlC family protein [Candidatus Cytomitobacter indipagum]